MTVVISGHTKDIKSSNVWLGIFTIWLLFKSKFFNLPNFSKLAFETFVREQLQGNELSCYYRTSALQRSRLSAKL